ncbi:MAG: hypothetical protein AB1521_09560 [Bacteroidota bacterium]
MKIIGKICLVLLTFVLVSCSSKKDIDEVLNGNYNVVIIPDSLSHNAAELNSNHRKEILVLMFNNFEEDDIKDYFGLNDKQYDEIINKLFSDGLIKKNEEGKFIPACMIIDNEYRNLVIKDFSAMSKNFAEIVIDRSSKIKDTYAKIVSFKNVPFEKMSDFIFYEVMLNKWQLKNIEEKFIKGEPPRRGESRYYIALQEKDWLTNNSMAPQINSEDDKKLFEMTGLVTDDLLNQLEYNRPLLVKSFLNSVYKDQISFREWFVWVYQFITVETKSILLQRSYIKQ